MSMISAQCDELRERAKELRNLAPDPDVPYLVPSTKEVMALAMRSAAGEMEDAADTIWQLRDDLQRTNAENAKLQASNEVIAEDHAALCEHNAKLRELLVGAFEDMDAWQKVIARSNEWGYGKGCLERLCKLRDAMQELGMEVVVG